MHDMQLTSRTAVMDRPRRVGRSPAEPRPSPADHRDRYTIIVGGRLDPRWSREFGPLKVQPRHDGTTALCGEVRDQSDLHGQIRRIESLGLTLISVQQDGTSNGPGGDR